MNVIRVVNARLYVEGWGFSGQIEEADIPALKWTPMELKNFGLKGKVKAPLGLDELKTTLKGHFDAGLVGLVSDPTRNTNFQIRADLADVSPIGIQKSGELVAFVRGWVEELNPGGLKGQAEAQGAQYVVHLVAYRLVAAGEELWDIDLLADRIVINGNEIWANE